MKKTTTMKFEREVVHSVLYKGNDKETLQNVYVPKFTCLKPLVNGGGWPKEIKLTIEWEDGKND
jgi:hypothetical protein